MAPVRKTAIALPTLMSATVMLLPRDHDEAKIVALAP
jgi:hypothetical protein